MTIRGGWAIGLLVLLALSLSANMLVVGFAAGRAITGNDGGGQSGGQSLGAQAVNMSGMEQLLRRLPDDIRPIVRAEFDSRTSEVRGLFVALRQARLGIATVLLAEPFDRAALDGQLQQVRDRTTDIQETLHDIFATALATLDADQRAAVLESWRQTR